MNQRLYDQLLRALSHHTMEYANKLARIQNKQRESMDLLFHSISLAPPVVSEEVIAYHDNIASLLQELEDREKELVLVYESYPYFFHASPDLLPAAEMLVNLKRIQIELLSDIKRRFGKSVEESLDFAPHADYWLEPGYRLEQVICGLTFPTSLVFDDCGDMYIAEAGYSYGPAYAEARVFRVCRDGSMEEFVSGFEGPLTGMAWFEGGLYIVTGSANGKVYRVNGRGEKEILIDGLRGGSDHFTSELAFGPDGKMYFAVGTTTNSGVVGVDNAYYGWLGLRPKDHDIPARDLHLVGQNFPSENPLNKINPEEKVVTGAFRPFGTPGHPREVVKGRRMANGVIYRANPDGSELEIVADGFRNIFGLGFSPDGRLFATNHGFDFRGSRPIEGDWDALYEVIPGWYGWPDFASGLPVTLPYFKPPGQAQPQFLLAVHPELAQQPYIRFKPHSATQKFDFCMDGAFGCVGEMFFAQFGSAPPITTGNQKPVGYRVVRANPFTGQVRDFLINLKPGMDKDGPERPIAVRFSPDGESLYVLDFGKLSAAATTAIPYSESGALWRISRA
ncbi:hypothetical protein [Brevibacillus brevis]|uniref:Glucose/Sorbosone dehydrogenase domain-containing protein n=1 Tax=Brevibacillus brevis TaxID=1393 RepID=A0ABY9T3I1_BREBE|nr:hypothetical protein [Brevibacillus brevis]WNC12958.1 hypothetical protein RGB73_19810 [Brevibacillus brevis]